MTESDVVIVGGGLAGLSAALQAAHLGRRCTVLTGTAPGGLLVGIESIQGLPGHPDGIAGYDLGPMTQEAAMDAGAECIAVEATALQHDDGSWVVHGPDVAVRAPAVIVASGSRLRKLGIAAEERLFGKGVSHCASCDAPLLRQRPVAVVGGGDAACQEALTLAAQCSQVHLLVRGGELAAQQVWRDRVAAQPRIVVRCGAAVEDVLGDAAVTGVRLVDGTQLAVDAVFVYAGLVPNTELLTGVAPLDAAGRIVVDGLLRASRPGLLAAGCVRSGSCGQAAGAAADGMAAAFSAHTYLDSGRWPSPTATT